jgi:(p)ppGpp synthase/HD superfamily hydrolase
MAGNANRNFEKALTFAVKQRRKMHQERKGTDFPYSVHPIRVVAILDQFGCDEDVVVAGFLHDTIEDTAVTAKQIERKFGSNAAHLVMAASEPDKSLPWKERKTHTLAHLRQESDADVLALVAPDKLDNVRSIAETLSQRGHEETWAIFNPQEPEQRWHYRELADVLRTKKPVSGLFRTLHAETQTLFPDEEDR